MSTKIGQRTYSKKQKKNEPLPKDTLDLKDRNSTVETKELLEKVNKTQYGGVTPSRSDIKDWRSLIPTEILEKVSKTTLEPVLSPRGGEGKNAIRENPDINAINARTKLALLTDEEKKARHKEQMKRWRDKNPDYNKTYRQRYYIENKEAILAKRKAKRDKERKIIEEYAKSVAVH